MAKVVTSQGIQDFVATGKHEVIKADPKPTKAEPAPPLEVKKDAPVADAGEKEPPKEPPKEEDIYSEEDQETKEEISKAKRFDALMRKKHRAMKEAQETAQENERFAENQYNRARLAEERAAQIDRELQELKAKATPKAPEKQKPDPAKYVDDKGQFKAYEYAEDLAAFSAEVAVAKDRQAQEEARKEAQVAEAARVAEARVAETKKRHPDFDALRERTDVRTHQQVLNYLTSSENIGEVSYYFMTHPEYVERINQMHPLKAIAEIGKLELTFEKPAQAKADEAAAPVVIPKASGAPAPIVPLSAQVSVNVNTDPAKMTYKELRAYERSRKRK